MERSLLIVYTGGTIGMKENPETRALAPFNFEQIEQEVPELRRFGYNIVTESLTPLVDSSDVDVDFWLRLAGIIEARYNEFDGFVVLHGTDTMAYTASALSFMLCNLSKPVVLTGSQLPIGAIRTDGKENLLGALEIAAAQADNQAIVPEVAIFFNHVLLRGNRATKFGAARFDAFKSYNYPPLAETGIAIRYHTQAIRPRGIGDLQVLKRFDAHVASLRLFPGIAQEAVEAVVGIPTLRGLVLETFGSGNAPSLPWLYDLLRHATSRGVIVVNTTQCAADSVTMAAYDAGLGLLQAGAISGADMTFEAVITKLMLALGEYPATNDATSYFLRNIAGEKS